MNLLLLLVFLGLIVTCVVFSVLNNQSLDSMKTETKTDFENISRKVVETHSSGVLQMATKQDEIKGGFELMFEEIKKRNELLEKQNEFLKNRNELVNGENDLLRELIHTKELDNREPDICMVVNGEEYIKQMFKKNIKGTSVTVEVDVWNVNKVDCYMYSPQDDYRTISYSLEKFVGDDLFIKYVNSIGLEQKENILTVNDDQSIEIYLSRLNYLGHLFYCIDHLNYKQHIRFILPSLRIKFPEYSFRTVMLFDFLQKTQKYMIHCVRMIPLNTSVTVVSCYYEMPSKASKMNYLRWASNLLSNKEMKMIVFTDIKHVETFKEMRQDDNILYKIVDFQDTEAYIKYNTKFEKEFEKDPERSIHKSHFLYLVWTQKNYFLRNVSKENPFNTTHFLWCDIGCFRNGPDEVCNFGKLLPFCEDGKMNISSVERKRSTDNTETDFTDRILLAGAIFGGDKKACDKWVEEYEYMISSYFSRNLFAGKDQNIYASMIINKPELANVWKAPFCNKWFGLQNILSGTSPFRLDSSFC